LQQKKTQQEYRKLHLVLLQKHHTNVTDVIKIIEKK